MIFDKKLLFFQTFLNLKKANLYKPHPPPPPTTTTTPSPWYKPPLFPKSQLVEVVVGGFYPELFCADKLSKIKVDPIDNRVTLLLFEMSTNTKKIVVWSLVEFQ